MGIENNSGEKQSSEHFPPLWAERLLGWYCKPELLEDLQGDLNEYFDRNVKEKGARYARLIYIIDVLKFFRLYTIRKPQFIHHFIHWLMLGSYIKTSGRTIVRNKLFSAINIIGLSVSMSVGLLMVAVLYDMFSYDKFHTNHRRIYRVTSRFEPADHREMRLATSTLKAAKAIEETFTGAEAVAILRTDFSGDLEFEEKTIPLHGYWANASFFNVFSFHLLEGNPATALKEPYSLVLSQEAARKLFGDSDALGKTVTYKDKNYTITGILKNVPTFSHMKFDMLGSLKTRESTERDNADEMAWNQPWYSWTYVLMQENADLSAFQHNLDQLCATENALTKEANIQLSLQPLDNIMIGENLSNRIGPVMGRMQLWIFGGLAFIIVLSACFNYTNLSIARSFTRTREIGIRKVIGALKIHVIGQFVIESVIISLLALMFSLGLFFLLRPYFLGIHPELRELLVLDLSPTLLAFFILFALTVGIVAGFYPALIFARINPIKVLKNLSTAPLFRKVTMRKALIVFQFIISILFITSAHIIFKQYKHYIAFDLGFSTENILNLRLQGNKADVLKQELSRLPEVQEMSQSMMITSLGSYYGSTMKNPTDPGDSANVWYNIVDENYIPLHDHKLMAGRNFTAKADSAEETEVIVNQQVLKRFNIADQQPERAINELVKVNGKELRIVGVLKDFQYGQANNNTSNELMLRYSNEKANYLNLKILSTDWPATYAKIEEIWKKVDPVKPMEAKFYDEALEETFVGLSASFKMAGFLATLAICIASLGLLGMVVFTTETRLKEISIRKVLGASETTLLYLLSKSFMVLLIIAAAIALPLLYLFFNNIIFRELANPAPLTAFEFFSGVIVEMMIALLIIGSQTLKAARVNPAETLKNE